MIIRSFINCRVTENSYNPSEQRDTAVRDN